MRIAFVCAEDESLGIGYLSGCLKKAGHEVFLVFEPMQFRRAYLRNQFLAKIFSREKENLEKIVSLEPDIIGFSCVTANFQWALSFSKKIKKVLKETPILFGGVHPTLVPEVVIKEPSIDIVCIGEGEEAILELADSIDKNEGRKDIKNFWFKKGKRVFKNPPRQLKTNLDSYPPPDKELFYEQLPPSYKENTSYLSSRGCPYNCTYCGNEQKRKIYQGLGPFVRQKKVENVVKELTLFKKKFGTKQILFGDDIFAINKQWLKDFAPKYKQEVGLPFSCFIHPKVFDFERAKILKKAGCTYAWFGIQSGSERIRKTVLDRFETNEEIINAAEICHRAGLKFMVDHIFDIPFESDKEVLEAISLYNKIRPDMINCYNLLYFPKSKILQHGLKAGKLSIKDVEKINRGLEIVYQSGVLSKKNKEARDYYRRYALLTVSIPLLPSWAVNKIKGSPKLINLFGELPLFLIPIVKVILDVKTGFGFIPLAVIETEFFFTRRFFKDKFNKLFT